MRPPHAPPTRGRHLLSWAAGVLVGSFAASVTAAPPTAEALIADSTKAMGGTSIEKIESYWCTAEMTGPMGAMVSHVYWAKPKQVLVKRVLPGMGEMVQGTDGTIGWTTNPGQGGYALVRDREMIDKILEQAMHIRMLRLKEFVGTELQLQGVTESQFDGARCYGVAFTSKKPGKPETGTIYFDAATNLLRGMHLSEQGKLATVTLKEWKRVGGVRFFHRMEIVDEQMNIAITFTTIEVNTVDPAMMTVPDEVAALVQSQPKQDAARLEGFSPAVRKMIEDMMEGLPWDNPTALRAVREGMASSVDKTPGEYGKAMKYVMQKIDEQLEKGGG